jgi:pimeloyl-ACP methyl ester carboxylesterase
MRGVARTIEAMLDVLGYTEVDVLGASLGGIAAQQLAHQAPRRVRRLVLAATGPGLGGVPGSPRVLLTLATPRRYYQQINRVLHIMATVQLHNPTEGRAYFDRKNASGKTSMEAMRSLKRRLSDIVYRQMLDHAMATAATGPGGHQGTSTDSSVTSSHPDAGSSDKSLPGPADTQPRTPLPMAS